MESIDTYTKIGKYEISDICYQSYPCKHIIKFEDGTTKLMSGDKIYLLFNSKGLSDPHIVSYKEYVRRLYFPTPDDLKNREDIHMDVYDDTKKRMKEGNRATREKLIEQYKASKNGKI